MSSYTADTRVAVCAFTRQPSGDEIIIGRPDFSVFLVLHRNDVQVLDDLAGGKSLGEAESLYHERHGEVPDLADFLEVLQSKDFVRPLASDDSSAADPRVAAFTQAPDPGSKTYLGRAVDQVAHFLFHPVSVGLWIAVILAALGALIAEPALMPARKALFFPDHMSFYGVIILCFSMTTAMFHELAHLMAARAAGVPAKIGVGNRLWVLVAETDITGVWSLPRRKRLLPILAGPMLDAVSASALILSLFVAGRSWSAAHPLASRFLEALILSYLLRLLWQCYLFVRTDFYYALIMMLDCKDLMQDTKNYLKNQARRLVRRAPQFDQSSISARERRVIQWYSLPFIAGRCLAFSVLFFVQIPTLGAYYRQVAKHLSAGYQMGGGEFVDSLILSSIGASFTVLGMYLWIKSLMVRRRTGNERAKLTA